LTPYAILVSGAAEHYAAPTNNIMGPQTKLVRRSEGKCQDQGCIAALCILDLPIKTCYS